MLSNDSERPIFSLPILAIEFVFSVYAFFILIFFYGWFIDFIKFYMSILSGVNIALEAFF